MATNLRSVERAVKRYLSKDWAKLDFEFEMEEKVFRASANLTLRNHDDGIRVIYSVYTGGMASFRAVFDKIDATSTALNLVNSFNDNEVYFCIFIRDDGYLEVRHSTAIYGEDMTADYLGECLSRLAKLADDNYLQRLTRLTH